MEWRGDSRGPETRSEKERKQFLGRKPTREKKVWDRQRLGRRRWGGENRKGVSTEIWKTNGGGMVWMKSEAEAESAALQGRHKGKEGCTLL